METKDKITKEDLTTMRAGEQKVFTMPSWDKARSGQSYANQMKRATMGTDEPMTFKAETGTPNPENGQTILIITRLQ